MLGRGRGGEGMAGERFSVLLVLFFSLLTFVEVQTCTVVLGRGARLEGRRDRPCGRRCCAGHTSVVTLIPRTPSPGVAGLLGGHELG